MKPSLLSSALEKLQDDFARLDFTGQAAPNGGAEPVYQWPGPADEDILLCVHKSTGAQEPFHRHDFFYFNYTWKGSYDSLSRRSDRRITIGEDELYAGQPFAGHALCAHDNRETVILGVLIRRTAFFRFFLPLLPADAGLFHFFIDPASRTDSSEALHVKVRRTAPARRLLELMAVEYAFKRPDTQQILKPLALAFLLEILREHTAVRGERAGEPLAARLVRYMDEHLSTVTLRDLAAHFSYHPDYISAVMRRGLGRSFSRMLLERRMERAAVLLKETPLSIEAVASMLGYGSSSNFHKAFRAYYHCTPRAFASRR